MPQFNHSDLDRRQSHDQSRNNHKKVLFNIAGSDEGLPVYYSDSSLVPPSSSTGNGPISCDVSDITGVTGSTFVSDVSIDIEQKGEVDEKIADEERAPSYSTDSKHQDNTEGKYYYTILYSSWY